MHVLRFTVDDTGYAVAIDRVVEVAPRVLITALPGAPSFIEGVFSFRQAACVAVSLRARLGHDVRAPSLDEHIVVVRGRRRLLGLVVDRVIGDEHLADDAIEDPDARTSHVSGVIALREGVVLIQDVEALLSDDEERTIDASIDG